MAKIPVNEEISKNLDTYKRISALLEHEDRMYTSPDFMLPLPNETAKGREVRKVWYETGFINIAWDLVSAPRDAIFKERIKLQFENSDANPLRMWSEDVNRCGYDVSFKQYLWETVAIALRAYGTVVTVIDRPAYKFKNRQDELDYGMPYITNIPLQDVLNWEYDDDGNFLWFAWKTKFSPPWLNPLEQQPKDVEVIKILTKESLITVGPNKQVDIKPHNFGFVPVVVQELYIPPNRGCGLIGVSSFFMSSNMIIMGNNMKSISDMELAKYGSSLLLMHEQAMSPYNTESDETGESKTKIHDPSGYNTLIWTGDEKPEYLAKDTEAIKEADDKAIAYFMTAIENERSMRSVIKKGKTGNDIAQSGIAKVIDATPVLLSLVTTSLSLEYYGKKVLDMVGKMLGTYDNPKYAYDLEFPRRFDIAYRALRDSLESIELMIRTKYPSEKGLKEMYKSLSDEITNDMDKQENINKEIDSAELEPEEAVLQRELEKELTVSAGE